MSSCRSVATVKSYTASQTLQPLQPNSQPASHPLQPNSQPSTSTKQPARHFNQTASQTLQPNSQPDISVMKPRLLHVLPALCMLARGFVQCSQPSQDGRNGPSTGSVSQAPATTSSFSEPRHRNNHPRTAVILEQEHVQPGDGSYSFHFSTDNGIYRYESGAPVSTASSHQEEQGGHQGSHQGGYRQQGGWRYADQHGNQVQVSFVADENGYRPIIGIQASPEQTQYPVPEVPQRYKQVSQQQYPVPEVLQRYNQVSQQQYPVPEVLQRYNQVSQQQYPVPEVPQRYNQVSQQQYPVPEYNHDERQLFQLNSGSEHELHSGSDHQINIGPELLLNITENRRLVEEFSRWSYRQLKNGVPR